ncbi:MAG: DUF4465 domain-containing protein [Saprospiraceae bacterium]|nr:DUF4465 domain-containing protein [Saprospiraceae bacterium]
MKKIILSSILVFLLADVNSQSVFVDFESYDLPEESFLNGADNPGGFTTNLLSFSNVYNPNYDFWYGWAISNVTDTITPGFTNQYSSIAGGGVDGSKHFAVSYDILGENIISLDPLIQGRGTVELYISNATFPYLSMRDGDGFAKKFGGEDGNDPDFFSLTIRKYLDGNISQDSVVIYLADYRFEDNDLDYILDDWTYVNLHPLGKVDSLSFVLNSSDVGNYGINTPAYFCVDNISVNIPLSTESEKLSPIKVYPNPALHTIQIDQLPVGNKTLTLYNAMGQKMTMLKTNNRTIAINLQDYQSGTYYLNILSSQGVNQFTFFKSEHQ